MRAALLIYGQARIVKDVIVHDFNYDTYAHLWITGKTNDGQIPICSDIVGIRKHMNDNYNLKKIFMDDERFFSPDDYLNEKTSRISWTGEQLTDSEISAMISQINSISFVCDLVDSRKYDFFILTRLDCEIVKSLPSLSSLLTDQIYYINDYLQIFGRNTLLIYSNLMKILKKYPTGTSFLSAEVLRDFPLLFNKIRHVELSQSTCHLVRRTKEHDLNNMNSISCIDDSNVYVRNICINMFMCKFPQGSHTLKFSVHIEGKYNVKFLIRCLDKIPIRMSVKAGDVEYSSWATNVHKINVWYNVTIKDVVIKNELSLLTLSCGDSLQIELADIYITES